MYFKTIIQIYFRSIFKFLKLYFLNYFDAAFNLF